jgi:hypothetical protein
MRIERPDRPGDLVGDLVRGLRERHFLLLSDGRRAAQMSWEEKHAMHRQIFHAEPSFHDPFRRLPGISGISGAQQGARERSSVIAT